MTTKEGKARVRVKLTGSDDTTPSIKLGFQCRLDEGTFKTCKARSKFEVKATGGQGQAAHARGPRARLLGQPRSDAGQGQLQGDQEAKE